MDQYLARAKEFMDKKDYRKAILTLQKARDGCKCNEAFRQENNQAKCHSSTKFCLLDSILKASVSEDRDAIYKAATGQCSCGTRKLSCDREAHVDALEKLSVCSEAIGKHTAAMGFAAAAVDLSPTSPLGYCRLSKLLRPGAKAQEPVLEGHDNEDLALGVVRQGLHNIKKYGSVQQPLFKVLQIIFKKLVRSDPFKWLPTELKVMVCSYLDTIDLFRAMRVSKSWLFAIRDDSDVWKKIYLPLRSRNDSSHARDLFKLIRRAPKAFSLAFSGIFLKDELYKPLLQALPDMRHLHVEDTSDPASDPGGLPFHGDWGDFQTKLARFTLNMTSSRSHALCRHIVHSCASSLKELHLLHTLCTHQITFPLTMTTGLPSLKVLRINTEEHKHNLGLITMTSLCRLTPNLEQLCIDGPFQTEFDELYSNEVWPKLKVFVLGWQLYVHGRFARYLPRGIRVIDIVTDYPTGRQSRDFFVDPDGMRDVVDWPELEHFRCKKGISLANLSRMIQPSITSGTLKTLLLGDAPESDWTAGDLRFKSEHIQVIGFYGLGLHYSTPLGATMEVDAYVKLLENFPNWHTFQASIYTTGNSDLLKVLVNRPKTKRIFQTTLRGMDRDEVKAMAVKRGVSVYGSHIPVYFPWADDDGWHRGESDEVKDVCDQWMMNRGRWTRGQTSVVNQPFFRE